MTKRIKDSKMWVLCEHIHLFQYKIASHSESCSDEEEKNRDDFQSNRQKRSNQAVMQNNKYTSESIAAIYSNTSNHRAKIVFIAEKKMQSNDVKRQ